MLKPIKPHPSSSFALFVNCESLCVGDFNFIQGYFKGKDKKIDVLKLNFKRTFDLNYYYYCNYVHGTNYHDLRYIYTNDSAM